MTNKKDVKNRITIFEATLVAIFAFTFAPLLTSIIGFYYNFGQKLSLGKAIVYGIGFAIGASIGSGLYRLIKIKFPQITTKIDNYLVFEDKK